MNWVQTQQRSRVHESEDPFANSHLSLYEEPPEAVISIEEVEAAALDRLKVLRGIEDDRARGFTAAQRQDRTRKLVAQHLSGDDQYQAQRKDSISHFVLRLAYCRTPDLRQWFVSHECELLRHRFGLETKSSQTALLRAHEGKLKYREVSSAELDKVRPKLVQVLQSQLQQAAAAELARGFSTDAFYQVPWQQVPDLVAMRKVFLARGVAYVHRHDMGSVLISHFKTLLTQALDVTARNWVKHLAAEEEGRLAPIVDGLSQRYLGPDYGSGEHLPQDVVTCSQLPQRSKESFPLCMQKLYNGVREEHHLKHAGRQQLNLFLKGIGLPLEEALRFWRTEFAPRVPSDKFEKEYAYNVRHNYGKEGKRTSYTPYSCIKIISSTPGQGEHHGCPYKTSSGEQLAARLSQLGIEGGMVRQIVSKAKAGHYQLACGLAFEGVHHCSCDTGINHPNQYYVESRKVLAPEGAEGGAPIKQEAPTQEAGT